MGDGAGALALVKVCAGTPPFTRKKQTTGLRSTSGTQSAGELQQLDLLSLR
jgi:hypothetical protein